MSWRKTEATGQGTLHDPTGDTTTVPHCDVADTNKKRNITSSPTPIRSATVPGVSIPVAVVFVHTSIVHIIHNKCFKVHVCG